MFPSQLREGGVAKAYLVTEVVNTEKGDTMGLNFSPEGWTGEESSDDYDCYLARELTCKSCGKVIGWQIVKSFNVAKTYKEGKYVIYTSNLTTVK